MKEESKKYDNAGNEITKEDVLKTFGGEKKHKKLRLLKWLRDILKTIKK